MTTDPGELSAEIIERGYGIRAAYWSGQPRAEPIRLEHLTAHLRQPRGLVWVHVRSFDAAKTAAYLTGSLGLHHLEVEDALSSQERPALTLEPDGLFFVATLVRSAGAHEHYIEIGFFLRRSTLITVVNEACPELDRWFERWQMLPERMARTPAMLAHGLVDAIVDDYFPALDAIQSDLQEMEDAIFSGRRPSLRDGIRGKRRLLEMRRRISPLRDILNGLLRRDVEWIPEPTKIYYQDVYDHTLRLIELCDLQREILASMLDAHLTITSNRTNEVMRTLTVISTCLMSAALIAGIYGMNFKYMPELNWVGGYPFAFLLMAFVIGIEIYFFKRKKWI